MTKEPPLYKLQKEVVALLKKIQEERKQKKLHNRIIRKIKDTYERISKKRIRQ